VYIRHEMFAHHSVDDLDGSVRMLLECYCMVVLQCYTSHITRTVLLWC